MRGAIGRREIAMLVISSVILFIDGFDMYFLGKIAPAVAHGLGGKPADMTPVFTWQQIGLAAGAFLMPPLADRFGRRPTLAICLCGFGFLSLGSAFVANLTQLTVLRGISGLFLAGAFPIGLTLLSEMTPQRTRAPFMAISLVFLSGGNIASGGVAAWLLDLYGWQIGFVLAGILPLLALAAAADRSGIARLPRRARPARPARRAADPPDGPGGAAHRQRALPPRRPGSG